MGARMTPLVGKVAVITGGASGIGAATAARFRAAGADIVIADVAVPGDALTAGPTGLAIGGDLAVPGTAARIIDAVLARFGRCDVLVNSAGIGLDAPLAATSRATLDRILAVNVGGLFEMTQAAAAVMVRQGSGAIVNIASISGLVGSKGRVAYGGSKGAVVTMTRVLATELGRHGVRVNAVAPGPVETPMAAIHSAADRRAYLERIPLGRYAEPGDIAEACLFLASDAAAYVTGQVLAVDGGYTSAGLMPE
jgi:3-oxoacyl-[acyl-carrier protein] reductase